MFQHRHVLKSLACAALFFTALFFAAQASSALAQELKTESSAKVGGYPLAAARREAIDVRAFHRPLDEAKVRKWRELASRTTMDEFQIFLDPLTPEEAQLLEKLKSMTPPIVNRTHFEDLRGVLRSGGLLSLEREEALGGGQVKHTTPGVENLLYGAYNCVFASIGPPHGSPRYGDVVIRLKDSVRENGWATPFSGMHFMYAVRHKDARKMQEILAGGGRLPTSPTNPLALGFDDRLHFSHYVVTEKHWQRALAYQAILVRRNLDSSTAGEKAKDRFSAMLKESDLNKFWELFIPARRENLTPEQQAARVPFGYLEGKFPDRLSIEDFTAIEVPPEKLQEVLAWPESATHRHLIRAKPAGVP